MDKDRPDLLLLHGALGSKSQFLPLLPLLEDHFRLHTLDFEGHGTAPPRERAFRLEHFAENVIEYLDQHTLNRINIFGYSMGGAVGLYLVKSVPERIERIHTLATKFNWTPEVVERERAFLDPDTILRKVPQFADILKERHIASGWRNVFKKTEEMFLNLAVRNVLPEEEMGRISTNVRVGLGDRDQMVSLEETVNVYRLLPNSELQVFPGTPHPLEQVPLPDLVHSLLSFFG